MPNNDMARVCVLERRLDDHEREHEQGRAELTRHDAEKERRDAERDARLAALEEKMAGLRTDFEVLKSRVAMYAGLGAALGGIAVNVASTVISQWLR